MRGGLSQFVRILDAMCNPTTPYFTDPVEDEPELPLGLMPRVRVVALRDLERPDAVPLR